MWQTLFHVPPVILGWPVFGFGWLFLIWWAVGLYSLAITVFRQGWGRDALVQVVVLPIACLAIVLAPRFVEFDGLTIRGYGVMLLAGILAGYGMSWRRARQMGVHTEYIYLLAVWSVLSGILGARIFYVIEYWDQFQQATVLKTLLEFASFTKGGLVVYGALMASAVAFLFLVRRYRLPPFALADLVAPSLVLGLALGRVGCFANGCCFGGPTIVPWAVTFPYSTPPFLRQVELRQIFLHGLQLKSARDGTAVVVAKVDPGSAAEAAGVRPGAEIIAVGGIPVFSQQDALEKLLKLRPSGEIDVTIAGQEKPVTWLAAEPLPRSRPIHPAQLYSALDALILCLLLLAWYPFRRRDGEVIALGLTLHSITRFLLEIIRTDEGAFLGTGLSISQNISLGILVASIGLWVWILSRPPGLSFPPQADSLAARGPVRAGAAT